MKFFMAGYLMNFSFIIIISAMFRLSQNKPVFFILTLVFFSMNLSAQDNERAEAAVQKYMQKRYTDSEYIPHSFSNTFGYPYKGFIEKKLETDEKVEWSVIHTLTVNGRKIESECFHLDSAYRVIGHLSEQEMLEVFMDVFYSSDETKQKLKELEVDTVFFSIQTKPKE